MAPGPRNSPAPEVLLPTIGTAIGIGIGVQEGPIKANPWDMNGPAFHLARLALENARKKKDP
ncbi:hypothetical protein ACP3TJ_01470 [Desulforudis sp. 1088]|uniref:hypothetical protein n=1 Tax=unclassified Candidatus Desulforudis TaxID=2635950 RepID=UPI003CE506DB